MLPTLGGLKSLSQFFRPLYALAAFAESYWLVLRSVSFILTGVAAPDIRSFADYVLAGTDVTTLDLCPTYPWYADNLPAARRGQYYVRPDLRNGLLEDLNARGLDPRVSYYALVAGGVPTPSYFWGSYGGWPLQLGFQLGFQLGYDAGDGVVPLRSQLANDTNWPRGTGPGKLHVFENVGAVGHTHYFESPEVQADVEQILWAD